MARDDPQININVSESLKNELRKIADKNQRSLTAEIVSRLNSSLEAERIASMANDGDSVSKLAFCLATARKSLDTAEKVALVLAENTGELTVGEKTAGFSEADQQILTALSSMSDEQKNNLLKLISSLKS